MPRPVDPGFGGTSENSGSAGTLNHTPDRRVVLRRRSSTVSRQDRLGWVLRRLGRCRARLCGRYDYVPCNRDHLLHGGLRLLLHPRPLRMASSGYAVSRWRVPAVCHLKATTMPFDPAVTSFGTPARLPCHVWKVACMPRVLSSHLDRVGGLVSCTICDYGLAAIA